MDEKQIIEYMNKNKLGLNDTFQFGCKGCGKCCKHREDIILTAYDLFRIAKYLGRSMDDVIERYCEAYTGDNTHFLRVRAKPVPPNNACPFQRGKKCIIHPAKPLVCATPLGRSYMLGREDPIYFLRPEINCGKMDETNTVRNWLGGFSTEEAERAGKLWTDVSLDLVDALRKEWSTLNPTQKHELENAQFNMLYRLYDPDKPFISQFINNAVMLFLAFIPLINVEHLPGWLPIPDELDLESKKLLLERKAYERYILDWCDCRGFMLSDMNSIDGLFPDGCCFVCFAEFKDAEYMDASYMECLFDVNDFVLWNQIMELHP